MLIEQKKWTERMGWTEHGTKAPPFTPQLVLFFGGRALVEDGTRFSEAKAFYPNAHIISCSTAGEILDTQVQDESVSLTAIQFQQTTLKFAQKNIDNYEASFEVGTQLARELIGEGLVHVFVFSDGLHVNGTQLVKGLNEALGAAVSVTGGLSGDGSDFKKTFVGLDEHGTEKNVVAVGLYSSHLKIGYGSLGGWDTFGLERTITKSHNNILFELDGKPALTLYKEYLGDQAAGLPSTALLFPLRLQTQSNGVEAEVVRTILAVNEADQSMTFAGDMPQGARVNLMKANFERLIDGASGAGSKSVEQFGTVIPELAILISCVGRKLVLKERVEEEVEAVRAAIGTGPAIAGFYSYGELCPTASTDKQCELHNQTMTITTLREEQ